MTTAYCNCSSMLLRDLMEIYPGLFKEISVTFEFDCDQLPKELEGKKVTFSVNKNIVNGEITTPTVIFKEAD